MNRVTLYRTRALVLTFFFFAFVAAQSIKPPSTQPARVPKTQPLQFDEQQAFRYLTKQTSFGPRHPGSKGHAQCQEYLEKELQRLSDAVQLQTFTYLAADGKAYQLTNIISSFNLNATKRILLTAHWDTRAVADKDTEEKNRTRPILGANDGASGVAVLLEIARQMKLLAPPIGVDLILFDGEDVGTSGKPETFCTGSRYFAKNKAQGFRPRFAINLDMIGDAVLEIKREQYSDQYARDVVDLVFKSAAEVGSVQFKNVPGFQVYDDHVPLNEAGIRSIDLIDFDYPNSEKNYWHTLEDTPIHCSPKSLGAVGKALIHLLYSQGAQ
ncbi:MAG: M28 family peptidase [bacterium]